MRAWLAAACCALSMGLASAAAEAADRCDAPSTLIGLQGPLPHLSAKLAAGRKARIVAFGSSSTYGTGASTPEAAYPARLEHELATRFPTARITVINKGVPGEASAEMMARFDRDTRDQRPDLVIWQTGTNDVARGGDLDAFLQRTRDGIARLRRAGTDVILMEPQYYPKLLETEGYEGYLQRIRSLGRELGVPVLRRFDLMVHWKKTGMPMNALLASDHFHMHDESYACLARVLASGIAGAVRTGGPQLVAAQAP